MNRKLTGLDDGPPNSIIRHGSKREPLEAREWLNGQYLYIGMERTLIEPSTLRDTETLTLTIEQLCKLLNSFAAARRGTP